VAAPNQLLHNIRPDEPGTTGYEVAHLSVPPFEILFEITSSAPTAVADLYGKRRLATQLWGQFKRGE
jgi:hypothetical protein